MKHDFSKAQKGKFFRSDAEFNLPIYLDADNRAYIEEIAQSKRCDISTVVNELIRSQKQAMPHPGL